METILRIQRRFALPPFRPSYQGWKPLGVSGFSSGDELLDLPIRDGNSLSRVDAAKVEALLDLPIRDGNSDTGKLHQVLPGPFRPSYQGWKLRFGRTLIIRTTHFYRRNRGVRPTLLTKW